ncbi:conserved hypothetical protein [uncultured Eubacteriales bacterium]|uniref:Uncharacterized protein n=1 Tax=uncultured Eubacteriales bacterium TaxID=172733 RepID=A0A212JSR6_9FIRM|nr:conserved hypothetical protein [uncultured Eubacteriales bacterium]
MSELKPCQENEMTLDEAIHYCREAVCRLKAKKECDCAKEHEQLLGWLEELKSIRRAQPDYIGDVTAMVAQPANAPLTLEELRGMDGEPMYSQKEDLWVLITINEYGPVLVFKDGSRCFAADWLETDCGPLYRRKPEGGDPHATR